ncbi:MAG: hypothetical protein Q9210_001438 [Variospora velana]
MINIKSLSSETQKVIEGVKKVAPELEKGTMDTITNLDNSVKDPKTVNKEDIKKASQLLGHQGSVVKQVTAALKPLIDWKPPKGIGEIVIPGLLNLPSPSLGDVWKDVGRLGAGLEEIELEAFPPADISRVVGIQNANRALYTEIKQTLAVVSQFINNPPQALQVIKKEAPKWVIGGTVMTLLAMSGSNPINSLPQMKATSTSPRPPAPTESKEAKVDWFLISIPDSIEKDWMAFITSLPDYDWPVRRQTYVAKLTLQEAQAANRNRLVDQLLINQVEIILNNVASHSTKLHKRKSSFAHGNVTELHRRTFAIQSRHNSPVHLKMLSAKPHADISSVHLAGPDYTYVNTIGRGAAIYIVDTGFSTLHSHVDYQRCGISPPQFSDAYLPILVDCWEAGIVTVFSAGNIHQSSQPFMGGYTPQRYGSGDNPLIIVAAGDKFGRPSSFNTPLGPANGARGRDRYIKGSYSILAMGEDLQTVQVDNTGGYEPGFGTSYAAPQVAGLAAYVLTLPGLEGRWNRTTVARDVKKYLLDHRRTFEYDGYAYAYNGIHGDPCAEQIPVGPWKSKRRISFVGMASISDYTTRMFKRQSTTVDNITLFRDGRLTDAKYAKEVGVP